MKKLPLFPLLLTIIVVCFLPMTNVFADENDTEKKEIKIKLAPQDVLFDIHDMKPGDWAPRTLAVKNDGSKDFTYQMTVQNKGEKKLFNELLVEIGVGGKELYNGKLAAFKSLPARKLAIGSEENLDITIRFPEHLGNEFQGADSVFAFVFTAEGKDGDKGSAVIPGEVGNGSDSKTTDPNSDPSEDESDGSTTPDDPSGDSESNSPDEPSGDSEPASPEDDESSTDSGLPASPSNDPESGSSDSGDSEAGTAVKTAKPVGAVLPATSTNIFNLLLFGSALLALGIVLMLFMYYRRLKLLQR